MNKTVGIVVAIVIIAAGVYFFTRSGSEENNTKGESGSVSSADQDNQQNSSLKSLMALGKSQKCEFKSTDEQGTAEGVFYISNGKSRGDISATYQGQASKTYMIYDNNTSYIWMDGSNTGFKMAIDAKDSQSTATDQSQGVDPNKDYKFDCDSWNADNSMFTPPSNVEFKDFSIPTTPTSSTLPAGSMSADTICASLTGDPKNQCEAALKKN